MISEVGWIPIQLIRSNEWISGRDSRINSFLFNFTFNLQVLVMNDWIIHTHKIQVCTNILMHPVPMCAIRCSLSREIKLNLSSALSVMLPWTRPIYSQLHTTTILRHPWTELTPKYFGHFKSSKIVFCSGPRWRHWVTNQILKRVKKVDLLDYLLSSTRDD